MLAVITFEFIFFIYELMLLGKKVVEYLYFSKKDLNDALIKLLL
ncbi:hypothetical protein D925_01322 [Enterococcus faecalis B83616-1]|nr:hypothetical protein D925_01322 [Enterococcus faecalis B83616-1]